MQMQRQELVLLGLPMVVLAHAPSSLDIVPLQQSWRRGCPSTEREASVSGNTCDSRLLALRHGPSEHIPLLVHISLTCCFASSLSIQKYPGRESPTEVSLCLLPVATSGVVAPHRVVCTIGCDLSGRQTSAGRNRIGVVASGEHAHNGVHSVTVAAAELVTCATGRCGLLSWS